MSEMDISEIAALVIRSRPYLDCFDNDHYPDCFSTFCRESEAFFGGLEDSSDAGLKSAATSLADLLEEGWQGLTRSAAREMSRKDKQVLALFLVPAAIEYSARHAGSEAAAAFADTLMSVWNTRFPRSTFLAGDYRSRI